MKQITKDTVLKQGNKSYSPIEVKEGIIWVDISFPILEEYPKMNPLAANFDLEGVPKIELEDDEVYTIEDVKESSIHFCDAYINSPSTVANKDLREVWELFKNSCLSWIKNRRIKKGYKANQNKYTEEDILEIAEKYHNTMCLHGNAKGKEYLQSLNSIKEITVDENFKLLNIK